MKDEHKMLINKFFEITKELQKSGVIWSTDYIGNIGEFIATDIYGIKLSKSGREKSLDGIDKNNRKVEIKFHNGSNRNNIILSGYKDNQNFEDLIVILGPDSKIKPDNIPKDCYVIYRINNYTYDKHKNIAKMKLQNMKYDKLLDKYLNEFTE